MVEQITLYTAKHSSYSQRVGLALAEAGLHDIVKYQVDMLNKPDWYVSKINPAGKVPAISYGGPKVSPDRPSPESVKITESLVLLEFIADLLPDSNLLPSNPVQRARVRFFINTISTKLIPGYMSFVYRGESSNELFRGIEDIQELIPENAVFAVGNNYTIADAAAGPFIARIELVLRNDMGAYKEGEGKKAFEMLKGSGYAKFWKYFYAITERPSFKSTYDEEYIKGVYSRRFSAMRAQKQTM